MGIHQGKKSQNEKIQNKSEETKKKKAASVPWNKVVGTGRRGEGSPEKGGGKTWETNKTTQKRKERAKQTVSARFCGGGVWKKAHPKEVGVPS